MADSEARQFKLEAVVQVEGGTPRVPGSGNRGIGEPGDQGIRASGNQPTDLSEGWDLVVANILAETIVELAPALVRHLAAEGTLIASGIITDRAEAVINALGENGLSLVERREEGEWVAVVARKGAKQDEGRRTKDG